VEKLARKGNNQPQKFWKEVGCCAASVRKDVIAKKVNNFLLWD
jgi:hypothetical protein